MAASPNKNIKTGKVDEPLQLIEFVCSGNTRKIKLKTDNLKRILKSCGDRPLSILTVCGPSRTGKRFLLNYMIRRLEAMESGNITDWIGWNQKTKPLSGFKFGSQSKPETQGIWVWSRPFIITTAEGKEVCVLLVDTRGTQDELKETKNMSAIVGLSFLISSVVVFNVFNDLEENTMAALNPYIQYGLLTLEHLEEGKGPFQKLIFLIRDWENPKKYRHGLEGGKCFLDEKLTGIWSNQPKVRKGIRKSFQSVECFLMPFIGREAVDPDFKGSISELNRTFALNLKKFISGVLNVNDMVIKEIHGKQVTASDFNSYLNMFVKTFNSEKTPSPIYMLEITLSVYNLIHARKAWRKYNESLKRKIRLTFYNNYVPETRLQTAHETAEREAKESYEKIDKAGDAKARKTAEMELTKMISRSYEQIKKMNNNRRRRCILEANNDSLNNYREDLQREFSLLVADNAEFYEEEGMRQMEKLTRLHILSMFPYKLDFYESNETLQNLKQALNGELDIIFQGLLDKNKLRRSKAEKEMYQKVMNLVEVYKTKLREHLMANMFDDFKSHEEFHDDLKKSAFESFEEICKAGRKEFNEIFLNELFTRVNETFESHCGKLKEIRELAESLMTTEFSLCHTEPEEIIPEALGEFEKTLQLSLPLRRLSQFHDESMITAISQKVRRKLLVVFMSKISYLPGGKIGKMITKLDSGIQKTLAEYTARNGEHRKQSAKLVDQVVHFLSNEFESCMNSYLKLDPRMDLESLRSLLEVEKRKVVDNFVNYWKPGSVEFHHMYKMKLEEALNGLSKRMEEKQREILERSA